MIYQGVSTISFMVVYLVGLQTVTVLLILAYKYDIKHDNLVFFLAKRYKMLLCRTRLVAFSKNYRNFAG